MNILYYTWFENSEDDIYNSLIAAGHIVEKVSFPFDNYDNDPVFQASFEKELSSKDYDGIFTFNFFPIISNVAKDAQIPYISWIYDNPHYTLFSNAVKNSCNYIFFFDKVQYEQFQRENLPHIYHMPLAVNHTRLNALLNTIPQHDLEKYSVSFVGSLYESNMYRQVNYLPDYLKGFINGLISSQMQIYGYNLIYDLLTDEITNEMSKYISIDMGDAYFIQNKNIFGDMISAELTHRERVLLLKSLAEKDRLALFTGSSKELIPKAEYYGYIGYLTDMPKVFACSKININLTLRSITSGIPLRALDIMGAGGFLLSNYQPELDQYFEDGSELVLFDSKDDLLEKTSYYLSHEKQRREIAENGRRKVQKEFSYESQLTKIFNTVFTK